MNESNGLEESRLSSESQDLGVKIAATLAGQLEEFDAQFNAIISQVSDVYVLNVIAAKKHEFILELIGTIERKMNERMSELRDFHIGVANNLISGLSQTLVEGSLAKERATAKRIEATPAASLKLVSYSEFLEEKRKERSNLFSLKVPEQPTDSDRDALKLLGVTPEKLTELKSKNNK